MDFWTVFVVATHVVIAPLAAGHALLFKRDPRSAVGWVSACLLFPVLGPIAYSLFGINRVQTRAQSLHTRHPLARIVGFERGQSFARRALAAPVNQHLIPGWFEPLAKLSSAVTGKPLEEGNTVKPLIDGEQAYPRMLQAIDDATSSILLMTYILDTDATGKEFVDKLAAARDRGVDVRVLVDGIGERYSRPTASKVLMRAGIRVSRFLPLKIVPPSFHLNLRNHRKLLLVDGQTAFAGGMNIGSRHLVTDPTNRKPTQDLHFEFCGPIVGQLYNVFRETWAFAAHEELPDLDSLPERCGDELCRVIIDGPDDNLDKLEIVLLGAMTTARRSIVVMTPYFLPSREMVSALKNAALKGVDVLVVLPEKSNLRYVQWATQNLIGELLQQGIRIVRQPQPFSHSKLLIVDDFYCVIGSANIDARSLRLNFELGIEVVSRSFAQTLKAYVDASLSEGSAYTLEEVDGRSLPVRLRDAFFWLFVPYL